MTVHASIDGDLQVVKFDVDLGSLPNEDIGYEFVVSFTDLGIQNEGEFFTDSNGLEMQRRLLNHRPTWDIQENYKDSF